MMEDGSESGVGVAVAGAPDQQASCSQTDQRQMQLRR